jgi:hypothetical protein
MLSHLFLLFYLLSSSYSSKFELICFHKAKQHIERGRQQGLDLARGSTSE